MAIIRVVGESDLVLIRRHLEPEANSAYAGQANDLIALIQRAHGGEGAAVLTVGLQGELLGLAVLMVPEADVAELAALWTVASHRRRGLARAMLASFEPVWKDATTTVRLPERCDIGVVGQLLSQFGFEQSARSPRQWRTRRVRRTTGRSSLVRGPLHS